MKDNIYVFLDFEFNCPEKKDEGRREIVSMAAVFRYSDGSPLTSFYSIVKPSRSIRISPQTTRMTGITQSQINKSKKFDKVSRKFLDLVECFSPSEFFVWGNSDSTEVKKSARYSHADKRINEISDEFHDLQIDVMNELHLPNIYNLERAADIYGINFTHTFSAIADAECLADIYFAYKKGAYDEEKIISYNKYYEYKNIIGNYKLIKNNIKTSEIKLARLERKSLESEEDFEKYNIKINETLDYIDDQKERAKKLLPLVREAELFLANNKKSGG